MQDTVIEDLNDTVWATLAPSRIHGIGVFAIRDIPKGQRVYAVMHGRTWLKLDDFTGLHPAILTIIKQRWPMATGGFKFLSPNDDARLVSFMNHSKTPNYDYRTDTSLRHIQEGEELTEDYGDYAPVDNHVA